MALALASAVLILSTVSGVYADNSAEAFYPLPYLASGSVQQYFDNGVPIGVFSGANTFNVRAIETGATNYGVKSGVVYDSGVYTLYSYIPDNPNVYPSVSYTYINQNNSVGTLGANTLVSNNIYFRISPSYSTYSGPFFTSLSDFIDYTPSAPVSVQGYTSLEAGNIVYFDLGTNKAYDISMQSAFYSYSGVLSRSWADDNRRYGFVDELPTANTNLSESAGTLIPWSPDASAQTIVGTSNQGVASFSGTTSGRYMWVINPLYNNKYYDDALSAKALNGLMKIYGVPAGTTVYTYKLKQSATSLGLDNDIPSVSGGVGTVSENEGQDTPFVSTDDNTTPYTQPVGGDTSAPETVTASEGIRQTLNQFVEMFNNLFTAPAEHIQHLIQAGQGFIQAIAGLFTWLPSSVIDVFTSALVLMIVIGVLKMLL